MSESSQSVSKGAPNAGAAASSGSPSLDDLFRRTLIRRPQSLALIDPPNKQRVTGQSPLRLTYADADRAISAVAATFADAGLPPGSVVAVQLPNTVEFPIAILAALRAGMIVALLPQLWRQSELTAALNQIGARAIVSIGRIELVDHAELAMNAAAGVFSIRHVFGFGNHPPDGMTRLTIETKGGSDSALPSQLDPRRPAIVTFDVTPDGTRAVPRSHVQIIAGGLAIQLESGLPSGANILSSIALSSFGGVATSLATWLLSGGSLALHHPGDLQVLERQIAEPHHDALVAPAPLALRLCEAAAFASRSGIGHVIGVWRMPDRAASSETWQDRKTGLTDVLLFGEIGLLGAQRLADGAPAPINPGLQSAPRAVTGSRVVGETIITPKGTLALRGVMVPVAAYQRPGLSDEQLRDAPQQADTGYGARLNAKTGALELTSPPGGIFAVGGYRFRSRDLDEWSKRLGPDATLAALPDPLNGHRLAGRADDKRRVREALGELGLNPLMIEAFRNRADTP